MSGIQSAVNAAAPGDTIALGNGVYNNSDLPAIDVDKSIVIKSQSGDPEQCVINCPYGEQGPYEEWRAFNIHASLGDTVSIIGLSIFGGRSGEFNAGGGIYAASPALLQDLIIEECYAREGGSAFYLGAFSVVRSCIIRNNIAGGAMLVEGVIEDSSFFDNLKLNEFAVTNVIVNRSFLSSLEMDGECTVELNYSTIGNLWMFSGQLTASHSTFEFGQFDLGIAVFSCCYFLDPDFFLPDTSCIIEISYNDCDPDFIWTATFEDFPGDNGGLLVATWDNPSDSIVDPSTTIYSYSIQREDDSWTTIGGATWSPSGEYNVVLQTSDIFTIGQPVNSSNYRIVANTTTPGVEFFTPKFSAYSIDNIAPPMPIAAIEDGIGFRTLLWEIPDIPDYLEACVFRGSEPGFVPGEPLACTPSNEWSESHLSYYYYRVEFKDIHGNLSEFSDELVGNFPTSVDPDSPHVFSVKQNFPNPFNPSTIIEFSLPDNLFVSLLVYDVSGRRVNTLILHESLDAGHHMATWDGTFENGRRAPAGVYFCKLIAGKNTAVRRMVLLK